MHRSFASLEQEALRVGGFGVKLLQDPRNQKEQACSVLYSLVRYSQEHLIFVFVVLIVLVILVNFHDNTNPLLSPYHPIKRHL